MEYVIIKFNDGENKYKITQLVKFCKLFNDLFGDCDITRDSGIISIPFSQACFDNLLEKKVVDDVVLSIKLENYLRVYNSVITADFMQLHTANKDHLKLIVDALDWVSFEKLFITLSSNFLSNNFNVILAPKIVISISNISNLSLEIFRMCNISLLGYVLVSYDSNNYNVSLDQIQNQYIYIYIYWYNKYRKQAIKVNNSICPLDTRLVEMINKITNPLIIILLFEYITNVYNEDKYHLINEAEKIDLYVNNYLDKLKK